MAHFLVSIPFSRSFSIILPLLENAINHHSPQFRHRRKLPRTLPRPRLIRILRLLTGIRNQSLLPRPSRLFLRILFARRRCVFTYIWHTSRFSDSSRFVSSISSRTFPYSVEQSFLRWCLCN